MFYLDIVFTMLVNRETVSVWTGIIVRFFIFVMCYTTKYYVIIYNYRVILQYYYVIVVCYTSHSASINK